MKKIIMIIFSSYFLACSAVANTQCPTGQNFDSKVNRCLTNAQTARIQKEVKNRCQGISGADFDNCYIQTATENLQKDGVAETENHQKGLFGSNAGLNVASVATLLSTRYLLTRNKKDNCKAISMKLAMWGGITSALGEVSSNILYRSGLRKGVKDYKGKVIAEKEEYKQEQQRIEDSYFNQIAAFDFLIDQEEKKRTALITRGGAYAASAGFYTAAGVMTIIEAIRSVKGDGSVNCPSATKTEDTNNNTGSDEKNTGLNTAKIQQAGSMASSLNKKGTPTVTVDEVSIDGAYDDKGNLIEGYGQNSISRTNVDGVEGIVDENGKFWKENIIEKDGETFHEFIDDNGNSFRNQKPQSFNWQPTQINPFFSEYENYVLSLNFQESEIDRITREVAYLEVAFNKLFGAIETNNRVDFAKAVLSIISIDKAYAQVDLSELEKGSVWTDILTEFKNILIPAGSAFLVTQGAKMIAGDEVLNKAFTSPIGRGIYTGLLAGYSTAVSVDSFKKVGASKDRIEAIKKVRDSLEKNQLTLTGCTIADRKDSKKPACYCYTENNEPNMARSNQQVCKTQWGDVRIAGAKDYNQSGTSSSTGKVCLASTYKVDEGCSCRSSNSGKSSCLSFGNIGEFNALGANSFGKSASDLANNVASGNYNSGNVLAEAGRNLAMQSKKISDKLAATNPEAKKIRASIQSQAAKLQNAHSRAMGGSGNNMAMRSPFDATPLSNLDPKKAVEEVEKSIAAAQAYEEGKAQVKKSTGDDNMNFDFGGGSSAGSVVIDDDLGEVMDKDFNYAENDINNRPGDSIFKILTLRYQTSGLRRLFDDKNEFQAEAASGNEIHGN